MYVFGSIFVLSSLCIAIFVKESRNNQTIVSAKKISLLKAYTMILKIFKNPNFRWLTLVLLTIKVSLRDLGIDPNR